MKKAVGLSERPDVEPANTTVVGGAPEGTDRVNEHPNDYRIAADSVAGSMAGTSASKRNSSASRAGTEAASCS